MTVEWSSDSSGDLSGDVVMVQVAHEGMSGEQVTKRAKMSRQERQKMKNRAQDHNMMPFLEWSLPHDLG